MGPAVKQIWWVAPNQKISKGSWQNNNLTWIEIFLGWICIMFIATVLAQSVCGDATAIIMWLGFSSQEIKIDATRLCIWKQVNTYIATDWNTVLHLLWKSLVEAICVDKFYYRASIIVLMILCINLFRISVLFFCIMLQIPCVIQINLKIIVITIC